MVLLCGLTPGTRAVAAPVLQYDFGGVGEDGIVVNVAGPELSGQLRGGAKVVPLPDEEAGAALELDGRAGCCLAAARGSRAIPTVVGGCMLEGHMA